MNVIVLATYFFLLVPFYGIKNSLRADTLNVILAGVENQVQVATNNLPASFDITEADSLHLVREIIQTGKNNSVKINSP
jgi:hypothetical protein